MWLRSANCLAAPADAAAAVTALAAACPQDLILYIPCPQSSRRDYRPFNSVSEDTKSTVPSPPSSCQSSSSPSSAAAADRQMCALPGHLVRFRIPTSTCEFISLLDIDEQQLQEMLPSSVTVFPYTLQLIRKHIIRSLLATLRFSCPPTLPPILRLIPAYTLHRFLAPCPLASDRLLPAAAAAVTATGVSASNKFFSRTAKDAAVTTPFAAADADAIERSLATCNRFLPSDLVTLFPGTPLFDDAARAAASPSSVGAVVSDSAGASSSFAAALLAAANSQAAVFYTFFLWKNFFFSPIDFEVAVAVGLQPSSPSDAAAAAALAAAVCTAETLSTCQCACAATSALEIDSSSSTDESRKWRDSKNCVCRRANMLERDDIALRKKGGGVTFGDWTDDEEEHAEDDLQHFLREIFCKKNSIVYSSMPRPLSFALPICPRVAALRILAFWSCLAQLQLPDELQQQSQLQRQQYEWKADVGGDQWWRRQNSAEASQDKCSGSTSSIRLLQQLQQSFDSSMEVLLGRQRHAMQQLRLRQSCEMEEACGVRDKYAASQQKATAARPANKSGRPAAATEMSHSEATTSAELEGGHGKQEAVRGDGRTALENNLPAAGERREVEVAARDCRHWTGSTTQEADVQSVAAGQPATTTAHVQHLDPNTKRQYDSGTELSGNSARSISDGDRERPVSSRTNDASIVARGVWEKKPPVESLAAADDATDVIVADSTSSSSELSSSSLSSVSEQKHQHLTSAEQERQHPVDLQVKSDKTHVGNNSFTVNDKVKALVLQHISELHLLELHWRGETTALRRQHLQDLKNVAVDLLLLRQAAREGLLAYPLVLPPLPSALESDLLGLPAEKKTLSLISRNEDASLSSRQPKVGFALIETKKTEGTNRHSSEISCKQRASINGSSTAASPSVTAAPAAAAVAQSVLAHSASGADNMEGIVAAFESQQLLQQQSISPAAYNIGLKSTKSSSTDKDIEVQRLLQQYLPKRSQRDLQPLPLQSRKDELLAGLSAFSPLLKKGQKALQQVTPQNGKAAAAATTTMKRDEHQQHQSHKDSQHVVIQRDKAVPIQHKSKEQPLRTSFLSKLNASFPWHFACSHCETAASSTPPIVDVERLLQPHAWQRMVGRWPEEQLLQRLKQHAILPLIFGMQRKRSIVIRVCSGFVTDICLNNVCSSHRDERNDTVEIGDMLGDNKTDNFHNASDGSGSYIPTKSEQSVIPLTSRYAGDFQALKCSMVGGLTAAMPPNYDYYPVETGCWGESSQTLFPQSVESQDVFCSCLSEDVERPEGLNYGCTRHTSSSTCWENIRYGISPTFEESPLSLNYPYPSTRRSSLSTSVAEGSDSVFSIKQERRQVCEQNEKFSNANFVAIKEETNKVSGSQTSYTSFVDGFSPVPDINSHDIHPLVSARPPYGRSCFDFLSPAADAAKSSLLAMLLPVGSSLQLRSPAHIQWENHISAKTDFVFPSIKEQRNMLFGYLSEQQYYKHILEEKMRGIRKMIHRHIPAETMQVNSSTLPPEKSKSLGHSTFSECLRTPLQSSTCSGSHTDVHSSAATFEINHMSLGDFFVSRHSNSGGVHAVFHLIVRDDKRSVHTETLHGASAGQAEIWKEAPTIPDAVHSGLTEVLRVCCEGGVRTLVLPLLLLEDDVATYSLPSALLQRRLFQILRCLINKLKALFQSNYRTPDLCQLVLVLPPVPKHDFLSQSACDTTELGHGSSSVTQQQPRKKIQEAVLAGTLAPGEAEWKLRDDDKLKVCAEMGGTDWQQLSSFDKKKKLFEKCWTDMLVQSTVAFVRNCGHCCAANPELPP